jgi:thiamine biosynthesis lipoprotein
VEIETARECCCGTWVELDAEQRTVRFRRDGVLLHLGAIGKGYALDRAAAVLRELGVQAALLDGGTSTVYALGAPPGEDAWVVGLCDPRDRDRRLAAVRLRDAALSTSGDYEQFFEWEGVRYSHLLDPRTGRPAQGTWSAMVTAPSAADTDALSTAAFVLGEAEADSVCQRFPDAGVALIPDAGAGDLRLECWGKFPAFMPTADS